MIQFKKFFLLLISLTIILSGCTIKTGIIQNELGYDFSPLILSDTRLDTSNLSQTTGDTDAFWFMENIDDQDVWTILNLSEDHKELWFYSKTWLFGSREIDLFQETQEKLIKTLNKLYGEPILFNADNNLVLFDRTVDPHTKIYGSTGTWKVSDHIFVSMFNSTGSGNVGIYEPDSVDDDIEYYLQINYRWDVEGILTDQ